MSKLIRVSAVVLSAALAFAGCATKHVELDRDHPPITLSATGRVTCFGEPAQIEELPKLLRDAGVPGDREIDILVQDDIKDPKLVRQVMAMLARNGYRRPICITQKRSRAYTKDGRDYSRAVKAIENSKYDDGEKIYYIGY